MEKKVNFVVNFEVPASDLNALQTATETSMDTIVRELLFSDSKYLGMVVSKNSVLEIAIGTGYFISSGAVYVKAAATTKSLTSLLPASNYRRCLVVATGEEAETEQQNRRYLVNAATRELQPRTVATRIARNAVVDVIAGAASANPSRPSVGNGYVVVAEFIIGPSGITSDPVMETANEADSLQEAMDNVALLKSQDAKFAAMMETIRSEISGLAVSVRNKADSIDLRNIIGDVLELRERLDVPDIATFWGVDSFGSASESDEAFSGYTARIEGGAMQMGTAEVTHKLIALANANDPKLDITESGLIMPKSSSDIRLSVTDFDSSVSIASYAVSTIVGRRKKHSNFFIYYATKPGREFATTFLDANPVIRVRKPEDYSWRSINLAGKRFRLKQIANSGKKGWEIHFDEPYWDMDTVEVSTTGSRLGQTFLCSQAGWHKRLDLYFTDVGATGNVRVKICELSEDALPDLQEIIADTTIAIADIVSGGWTRADFDPFYLRRGRRYAFVVTTAGDHELGCAISTGLSSGTAVATTDGTIWNTDLGKDLMFRLYACTFEKQRVVIDLEDITLTGGIREISSVISGHRPSGTKLIIQAKQAGGQWRNLADDDDTVLNSAPSQLSLRLVFIGTKDIMPAIDLSRSRVIASRPLLSSVHVSTVRSVGSAGYTTTDAITVREASWDFDEDDHNWTVTILHGASYATEVTATAVKTRTRADGAKMRIWTFDVPSVSTYRIKTLLEAVSANNTMSVTWRRDEAEAA